MHILNVDTDAEIKEVAMGGAYSAHEADEKCIQNFRWEA
jgi:hypothetical protein